MSALAFAERPARGTAAGLLVLNHGRGTGEHDLLPLADALDPQGRLHVIAPRGPLKLPGSPGAHWYVVRQVGRPDPPTFRASVADLAELHEMLWDRTGIGPERTILGGFSQGAVMSYAMGLDPGRPVPAGILAISGFVPEVEGWQPDLAGRAGLPVLIAHGRADGVIPVAFGRAAAEALTAGGLQVEYRESDAAHHVDPRELPALTAWMEATLAAAGGGDAERERRP